MYFVNGLPSLLHQLFGIARQGFGSLSESKRKQVARGKKIKIKGTHMTMNKGYESTLKVGSDLYMGESKEKS